MLLFTWQRPESTGSKSPLCLPGKSRHGSPAMPLLCPLLFLPLITFVPPSQASTSSPGPSHVPAHPSTVAAVPILRNSPFSVVWNMPTARCHRRYNIDLNLEDFNIVGNKRQRFQGQVRRLWPVGVCMDVYVWPRLFHLIRKRCDISMLKHTCADKVIHCHLKVVAHWLFTGLNCCGIIIFIAL